MIHALGYLKLIFHPLIWITLRNYRKKESPFTLRIIISRRENDPAYFYMESLQINQLSEDKMSLLFSGKVKNANSTYAELLLAHLIEKGFSGKKLLNEFKEKMLTKPAISSVQMAKILT